MSHRRVLLADAHPNMLEAVRGLLVGRFATTVMVTDEPSLLEAVGRMEPDLVVVDLSLPVVGGVNAVRSLFSRYPGLRVVVLSGSLLRSCSVRALASVASAARGIVVERHRDDLFRHWLLGFGSGDLTVRTGGPSPQQLPWPNVLGIRGKLKLIHTMLQEREVVRGSR